MNIVKLRSDAAAAAASNEMIVTNAAQRPQQTKRFPTRLEAKTIDRVNDISIQIEMQK